MNYVDPSGLINVALSGYGDRVRNISKINSISQNQKRNNYDRNEDIYTSGTQYIVNGYDYNDAQCSETGDKTQNDKLSLADIIFKVEREISFTERPMYILSGMCKGAISDAKFILEMQKYYPSTPAYYKKIVDDIYKIYNYEGTIAESKKKAEQFISYIKSIDIQESYEDFLKDMYDNPEKFLEYEGRFAYEVTKTIVLAKLIDLAKAEKAGQVASKADDVVDTASDIVKYGDDVVDAAIDFNKSIFDLSPDELIVYLENNGWEKTVKSGGKKSGTAIIMENPASGTKIRMHLTPSNNKPYFRIQNSAGDYLDKTGKFPSNATKQEMRDLTHFYFKK